MGEKSIPLKGGINFLNGFRIGSDIDPAISAIGLYIFGPIQLKIILIIMAKKKRLAL
jgi:hypothetical protein|tara:strand:- start:89 stop:259 length:171 start_codon:yes stop_codon:yes gene_type:complete